MAEISLIFGEEKNRPQAGSGSLTEWMQAGNFRPLGVH